MSERRAERFAVDLYISGNISPLTVFHKAKDFGSGQTVAAAT
jgi:hypothetical protein